MQSLWRQCHTLYTRRSSGSASRLAWERSGRCSSVGTLQVWLRRRSTGSHPNTHATNNSSYLSKPILQFVLSGTCILAGYLYGSSSSSAHNLNATQATLKVWPNLYGSEADFERAIEELRREIPLPEQTISTDSAILNSHGSSINDHHPGAPHTVVVYPMTTEDVIRIVNISRKYRMPIVPYSGGSGLEGHCSALACGGICIDMSNMNKILEINEADGDIVCQAGVGWIDINETLEEKGIPLFFPLDPSPDAMIGGMLSTGCSGTNAVRYGTARGEWFLNATVVLPSGEVIKTRRRARKSSAGFDMTKLFIGAEGTLGIVTEVTLRLTPRLQTSVAVCHFESVQTATEAVREVIEAGVPIQCVELVDDEFMKAANLHGNMSRKWEEKNGLFFKFQGSDASMRESGEVVRNIVTRYGGSGWQFAKDEAEAAELWRTRKNAHYIGLSLRPGSRGWATDVCVPVSKLPQLVQETKQDLKDSGILHTIVGHVGDGNFHTLMLFADEKELGVVRSAAKRMVKRALDLDGTCTGEHGVGLGKKEYLNEELGLGTVGLMKSIKQLIDPHNLFNPGKLYPDE